MTGKHKFLVDMLAGMNNKVSSLAEKLASLETRMQVLEEAGNIQTLIASVFQAANKRHNAMEPRSRNREQARQLFLNRGGGGGGGENQKKQPTV